MKTNIKLSKKAAQAIGEQLADTLHSYTTSEYRGTVLTARDDLLDILDSNARSALSVAFRARLDELEPLPCSHTYSTHPNEDPDICKKCSHDRADEH